MKPSPEAVDAAIAAYAATLIAVNERDGLPDLIAALNDERPAYLSALDAAYAVDMPTERERIATAIEVEIASRKQHDQAGADWHVGSHFGLGLAARIARQEPTP
jgi:hypothetical protein